MNDAFEKRTVTSADELPEPLVATPSVEDANAEEPSATALFDLYEQIAEKRPGTRDAEIFEKIREWTFSDFSLSAHQFVGISKQEMDEWQRRHRIHLSAGHIRPDPVDIQRGHAWGHIRMVNSLNRLHSEMGPPSAQELGLPSRNHQPRSPQSHGRDDAKTPSAEATRDSSRRDNTRQLAVDGDVLPLGQGAVA
ncbi:MAG TPA: hypothetical protein VGC39_06040 [Candidatus Methylacidiphilales bacterium]